jgi:hypothetical protein
METNLTGGKRMNYLKNASLKECISLLREFIDSSSVGTNKKEIAVLALQHLQKINAGNILDPKLMQLSDPKCNSQPRGDLPLFTA